MVEEVVPRVGCEEESGKQKADEDMGGDGEWCERYEVLVILGELE